MRQCLYSTHLVDQEPNLPACAIVTTFDSAPSTQPRQWVRILYRKFGLIRIDKIRSGWALRPIFEYWPWIWRTLLLFLTQKCVLRVGLSLMVTKSIWITVSSTVQIPYKIGKYRNFREKVMSWKLQASKRKTNMWGVIRTRGRSA